MGLEREMKIVQGKDEEEEGVEGERERWGWGTLVGSVAFDVLS